MSVKAAIRDKSAGLVKRERVTLPDCGVEVQIRALMAGEAYRAGHAKDFKQMAIMVALATEDPETGKPIWNANVLEDVQEMEAMRPLDIAFLVQSINRLSGDEGKMLAALSDQSTNGAKTTPSDSGSLEPSVALSGS